MELQKGWGRQPRDWERCGCQEKLRFSPPPNLLPSLLVWSIQRLRAPGPSPLLFQTAPAASALQFPFESCSRHREPSSTHFCCCCFEGRGVSCTAGSLFFEPHPAPPEQPLQVCLISLPLFPLVAVPPPGPACLTGPVSSQTPLRLPQPPASARTPGDRWREGPGAWEGGTPKKRAWEGAGRGREWLPGRLPG